LLITVPYKVMLTIPEVLQSPVGPLCEFLAPIPRPQSSSGHPFFQAPQEEEGIPQLYCMAIYLVWMMKHQDSKQYQFWKPYLDLLPTQHNSVLHFSEDEIEALKGSSIYETARARKRTILQMQRYLAKLVTGKKFGGLFDEPFTFEEFSWGYSIVSTRSFDNEGSVAILPIVDFINHNGVFHTSTNTQFDKDNKKIYLRSQSYTAAGKQIFLWYGAKPNSALLVSYGYLADNNENDLIIVDYKLKPGTPFQNWKQKLLDKFKAKEVFALAPKGVSRPIFTAWTISVLDHPAYFTPSLLENIIIRGTLQIPDLQLRAVQEGIRFCLENIAKWTTTLEEDEKQVLSPKLSVNMRNAIKLRILEKKIWTVIYQTLQNGEQWYKEGQVTLNPVEPVGLFMSS